MLYLDNHTTFDLWLKQRRRSLGLTRKELAERVGCSAITIVKIEAGERRPSRQIAELLADALNIPPGERDAFVEFARVGSRTPVAGNALLPVQDRVLSRPAPRQRPNNLPAQRTTFIGRREEVEAVVHLLRRPGTRLLTLNGPPGIGKTRLSLQASAEMLDDFANGVFFVPLAPASDPDLVLPTIAQALGVRDSGDQPLADALKSYLRARQMLLVLDNFEQVTAAAPVVGELLSAAPELKIMVTSREVLRLYGEQDFPVPPMAVPGTEQVNGNWTHYEALQLFSERASNAKYSFLMTSEDMRLATEICARLDGLPLAIELAAARVRDLSLGEMLAKIGDRLALLAHGPVDLPPRQRTLRGAISWSYDLLSESEQRVFRRMSIFVGGSTPEAAEKVIVGSEAEDGGSSGMLASLVAKNLLKRETDGEERYWMLETIRDYASEQLTGSGESDELRQRHAEYYMAFVEQAEVELQGRDQVAWLGRLDREYPNVRSALTWSQGQDGLRELGLRMAGALGKFWETRGYISEGRSMLAGVLSGMAEGEATPVAGKALSAAGRLALYPGDFQAARVSFEKSLAISRLLGNKPGIANALNNLGVVAQAQGENETARAAFAEALAIRRELGDKAGIANSLNSLGTLAVTMSDYASAVALTEEGLQIRRELGHKYGIMLSLANLGDARRLEGNYEAASELLEECLSMSQEAGNKPMIANALHTLGHVAQRCEDWARAAQFFSDSLKVYQELSEKPGIAECLAGLAELAAQKGEPERAARLFGAVDSILQDTGFHLSLLDRTEYERGIAAARAQISEEAWNSEWQHGSAMELEDVIAFALRR
jgi:predicted ATPase/transcriptional regulator with XRE-family HTH domain